MDPVTAGVLAAVVINEAAYHSHPHVVVVDSPPPPAPLPPAQERVISQRRLATSVARGWHYRLGEITTSDPRADLIRVQATARRYQVCITRIEEVVERFRVFADGGSQHLGTYPVERSERAPCHQEPAVGLALTVEGAGGNLLQAVSDANGQIDATLSRADLLKQGPTLTARVLGVAVRRPSEDFNALHAAAR
jgi:hypothetical protein